MIAALYLDGGLAAAHAFVSRTLGPELASALAPGVRDHKSALQEALQARGEPVPEYVVAAEEGPSHRKRFRVRCVIQGRDVAEGEGYSKKEAQQDAARQALEKLQSDR